ncbi:hypothetical protein OH76DRAFT_1324368, partial [Lentinus brumalis]
GLSKLLKQERQLRVGQMNDALHQVRVGVGLKSLLYRTEQAALDVQLQRYQVLRKGDLKSNTALIEHSVRGVSDLHLPWFWTLSAPGESRSGSWDEES